MNELQVFENEKFGQVRSTVIDGDPWFVAADVCKAVGIGNPSDVMRRLDEDETTLVSIEGTSNGLSVNAVSEAGLYSLVLGSRKPEAKEFKRWITHEVIPSIRKHGTYMTPETIEKVLLDPDAIIKIATALKEERKKNAKLTAENTEMKPKAEFADTVADSRGALNMGDFAKIVHTTYPNMGRNKLLAFLRGQKILTKGNIPYQKFINANYFRVIESVKGGNGVNFNQASTLILPKGQFFILDLLKKSECLEPSVVNA